MQPLDKLQVETLLAGASGNVSYQSMYARTTAVIADGRVTSLQYASDYMKALRDAEYKASYVAPRVPVVSGTRSLPYTGPFPRGKHSHRCKGCEARGQINAVACYKSHCTRPQLTATCSWCASYYGMR